MSSNWQVKGKVAAEGDLRSALPILPPGSLPGADCGQSGSPVTLHEWLGMLPVMAFLERGEEIAAANNLAREFVGSSESMKTDELFLGAYPAAGDALRQRFECLFASHGDPA